MILLPVPASDLDRLWPLVLPFAEQMERRFPDDWPASETLRQARETLQLWLVLEPAERTVYAAVGTTIVLKPTGKRVFRVKWAAGRQMRRWVHLVNDFDAVARDNDCTGIEIDPGSRGGWRRFLPGWRARPTLIMSKEL